jgi:5'(3')-deoxyribonucleotidase
MSALILLIRRICLDLDGVLNKFHQHIFHHLGFPDYDDTLYPTEAGWEIEDAANMLAGYKKFTSRKDFWDRITRDVWATAPKSDEFEFLLEASADLVGQENVIILTKPTIDPDCMAGKLEWIHANVPRWMRRQFLVGPSKEFCARPDTLLVDDADKNVNKFKEAGGMTLLVPRPWNSNARLLQGDRQTRREVPLVFLKSAFATFKSLQRGTHVGPALELPACYSRDLGPGGDGAEQLHHGANAV